MKKSELRQIIKEEISKVLKEELVDYEGDDMYQIINDDMKMYYKMDVPMDVIKDWADYYFPNTNYDKDEYEFETSAREDFLMFLNDEFGSGASRPEWWDI